MATARWWLSVPVAILCLLLTDAAIQLWQPRLQRLPEQFSAPFLERYVDQQHGTKPVLVLGDSVLWGYHVSASEAASSLLQRDIRSNHILNLSYEGGSSANTYFMLRYVLSRGVHPKVVVFNVNSKESNSADSAYKRLHPSLERVVTPLFDSSDRRRLDLQPAPTLAGQLDAFVARCWLLYRYRVDLREAIFGTDDAATALKDALQDVTGSSKLQAQAHRPTADRFLGTYDLSALEPDNVDFIYLHKLATLIRQQHLHVVAIMTPTNHTLLHDYIDAPDYDAKLMQMITVLREAKIKVMNLDKAFSFDEFIDNDHLNAAGNRRLAALLTGPIKAETSR